MKRLIFLLPILLCACKPDTKVINTPVSDAVKDFYDYKVGSYWIFKDSLSGEEDSMVVNRYEVRNAIPNSTTTSNDYIDIYVSIYRPGNNLDSISYRYDLVANQADLYLKVGANSELSYFIGTSPIQTFPVVVYATICNDTVYNISELFQQMNIQGYSYDSVYHIGIKHKLDACYSSARDDHFYINRHAAMIKMSFNNYTRKVWELVRWRIVR